MKIKICGITRLRDAELSIKLDAWALGFNFAPQSPRKVEVKTAIEISEKIPSHIEKVGVFVNAQKKEILKVAQEVGLTLIQLHGDETPDFCEELELPFIKAFRPRSTRDLEIAQGYIKLKNLHALMIDGVVEGSYGGTGVRADLNLALKMKTLGRVVLAGGLRPENVLEVCKQVKPFAVDVASGVESAHGIKDEDLLRNFFKEVRASGT